ncbi:PD40 domain-containing protein [Deinococcus sp. YIM 77859]|uniref:TolB family protein n=1 Tax=Deinococcus sp. YIM 77859 TaxID=1540221 RepID=UPI000552AB5D|nr:PD40 domain-containing protein [Deinococcus sp. YIM 77859]
MRRVLALTLALGTSVLAATLPSRAVLSGACCPGAVWTPDSRALLFLDGPPARASTGIYQVPAAGGPVTRRFSSVAFFSPRLLWAVRPGSGASTTVERLADGRKFTLPTYGADVIWNRAETQLAYTRTDTTGNFDRRTTRVFVADVFGAPRSVATVFGGGVVGWVNDRTLLLTGKRNPADRDRDLFTLDTRTGARGTLASALSFRGLSLSPDGAWVAYYVAFDSPARNGLWLRPAAGGAARKLTPFGAYRWRDERRLLLIPLMPDGSPHVLREYDVRANAWRTLGDLGDQVRQGDWSVSPDGRRLAYLSARDGNVRVVELPKEGARE